MKKLVITRTSRNQNKSKDALETLVKLRDELDTLKECINGFQPLTKVSRPSWSGYFEIFCHKKHENGQ